MFFFFCENVKAKYPIYTSFHSKCIRCNDEKRFVTMGHFLPVYCNINIKYYSSLAQNVNFLIEEKRTSTNEAPFL